MLRLKKSRKSKGNKYGAKKQTIDGIKFDSKAEAQYYLIYVKNNWQHFSVHESFEITPKFKLGKRNKRHRVYSPDFVKRDENGKILKVVDVKPEKITDGASLRMNQFEFIYKIPVTIARVDKRTHFFDEKEF